MDKSAFLPIVLIIIIGVFIGNIIVLDIFAVQQARNPKIQNQQAASGTTVIQNPLDVCPSNCLSQIYQATVSAKLIGPTPTPVVIVQQSSQVTTGVKEFFVAFGTGTSTANDWTNVGGLQAYVDSSAYRNVKTITFEASVQIPTGNETAYVRLFDGTNLHPVWFSDVSMEGGAPQFLVSQPITLDPGNNVYQVQMKTSLQYPAILNQARLHIVTN